MSRLPRKCNRKPKLTQFQNNDLWTEENKQMLLKGLREYGYTDIKNLSKMLPNKSVASIKAMIRKNMLYARRLNQCANSAPIDQWISRSLSHKVDTMIPEALLCIMLYENHPSPEECNGCDFRAAYDFIRRMTLGYPAIDLSPKTKKVIYKLITKTITAVIPKNKQDLMSTLKNLTKKKLAKDYTRKTKTTRKLGITAMLKELNTFMMLPEHLRCS